MRYQTIGVLAHVDAGKTTFSEQLLYQTGALSQAGRVDHGNTLLDNNRLERQRGITIFSDQALFTYHDTTYQLLDTPGHVDFSAEMERTLAVLDAAILVISAAEGLQSHSETIWRLLLTHRLPTLIFLNKCDLPNARLPQVLAELQQRLSPEVLDFSAGLTPALQEELALRDEALLEQYSSGQAREAQFWQAARALTAGQQLFPCFSGSALQGAGLGAFLEEGLARLTAPFTPAQDTFAARVFKVRHDEGGNRLSFLKLTGGALKVKDSLGEEKINEIRLYNGAKYQAVQQAQAGQLCAVLGPQTLRVGQGLGAESGAESYESVPMLSARVLYDEAIAPQTMLSWWRKLEEEDPQLAVTAADGQLTVRLMGQMQLEVLPELFRDRYGAEIRFGECQTAYRETIAAPVIGYGHYEPLRHYAEVHLRLDPRPYGSGISFHSACATDIFAAHWQNLVETHVFERDHKGILTGSPLSDVAITLLYGQAEQKHTSGGDFREATYRAIRQALEQAENVLLEPLYRFILDLPREALGRAMADIQKLQGSFGEPQFYGERTILTGLAPVSEMLNYDSELRSYSHGEGRLNLSFGGWQPCHNSAAVIEASGYDKNGDPNHTSASVFCSHGAGFTVPWDEVHQYVQHVKYTI